MTWTVTLAIWCVTGACGFALGRRMAARLPSPDSVQGSSQAPAWLERHQRLHTHASIAVKRQSIDGTRQVVRKETLKLHLSPHFMFNALSSVQWLWGEGRIDEAKHVFPSFVQLWKAHWREEGTRTHSLGDEFDTLEQYVKLEEVRLGRVVRWEVLCDNRTWLDTPIPSLLLQPAIENAIWHGFGGHEGPHAIVIEVSKSLATRAQDWLDIAIRDNGKGLPSDADLATNPMDTRGIDKVKHASVGLDVTRNRLLEHHGDANIVIRRAAPPWSTEVVLSLPVKVLVEPS